MAVDVSNYLQKGTPAKSPHCSTRHAQMHISSSTVVRNGCLLSVDDGGVGGGTEERVRIGGRSGMSVVTRGER